MHKQSFAECHSLATKAPLARPSMHFSSKIPEVSKKNSWSFQLKPQEFKQKTPVVSRGIAWVLFSYDQGYSIYAAAMAEIA